MKSYFKKLLYKVVFVEKNKIIKESLYSFTSKTANMARGPNLAHYLSSYSLRAEDWFYMVEKN